VIDAEPSGIRAWLSSLELFGIKLGLDAMRAISLALDAPEREWNAVHIAGTNGKGSVAALTAHALQSAGHSTGRYAGSTWYADTFADELDEGCERRPASSTRENVR